MTKLNKISENSYEVSKRKDFSPIRFFKEETIKQVFQFAYAMSFGKSGEHRNYRSGGSLKRKNGEIFINTFQGKLSELAIYNYFLIYNQEAYKKLSQPDLDVYGLGEWDDTDIQLNNIKFSIKSTSSKGNLLLLETKDWNENGEYIPNIEKDGKNSLYDYHILVRINPDGKKIMKSEKVFFANEIEEQKLWEIINSQKWEYDIAGFITNDELKYIIQNNFIIEKGSILNKYTTIDAENYYVQSGDMKEFKGLISSL